MRQLRLEAKRWPYVIGCVADTHVPRRAGALPPGLLRGLAGVDLILHAGDLVTGQVLLDLGAVAPVVAVAGNMDPADLDERLGRQVLVEVGSWRVGLVHGDEGRGSNTPERALGAFGLPGAAGQPVPGLEAPVDAVVFGHSHQPLCEERLGVLLLNPGSPTDPRLSPWASFGRMLLPGPEKAGRPTGEIVPLGG